MARYEPRRLTEGFVNSLPVDGRTTYNVRDTKVTGLIVSVNKRSKTYKVQRDLYRGDRGRRRLIKTVRHTLGTTDQLTLEAARLQAQDVIKKIMLGIDPNERAVTTKAEAWTLDTLFEEYVTDLKKRDRADRTMEYTRILRDRYLSDWKDRPVNELTRSMVRARHQEISQKHGKVVANQTMRAFRAAYNLALRIIDDPDALPDNPVKAVTFNKERRKNAVIQPDDLAHWWIGIQSLQNPLRRAMHELGLYSGLRPGTLVSLRREWIKLKQRTISIPKMKSGRSFDLPLSDHMAEIVERALGLSEMLFPGAPWLFPSRSTKDQPSRDKFKGHLIATQVWREKSIPSETGHILRHTYRTIAQRITIDKIEARLLLDHTVPGIDGVYIHEKALFDRLLVAQERMSAEITRLTRPVQERTADQLLDPTGLPYNMQVVQVPADEAILGLQSSRPDSTAGMPS